MGIDKDQSQLTAAAELRRQAEERLRTKKVQMHPPRNVEEMQRFVHELEVYQIELEMQGEEMRQARDKAETALEKYAELYDFAPVGYLTLDHEGIIRSVNLTGASLLGIERSRLLGRRFGLLVADETRPFFSEFFEKVFTNPAKEACEVALRKEGNSPLFVRIEGVAAASGQECRIVLIDITERKQAEVAARESEEEYRELVENANSIIMKMDRNGKISFFNDYAQKFFGYSLDEVLEENVKILVPSVESHSGRSLEEMADIILSNPDDFTENINENVLKNGERVWISWRNKAIRDASGNVVGNLAIGQDITERKLADEALQESEERRRMVLQASSIGTFEVDLQTGEGRWNNVEYELLGLKPGDAPGNPELFFQYVHPDDVGLLKADWENALRLGELDAEFRIVRADGQERWLAGKGRFLNADEVDGRSSQFLGVNFDITARKQAEKSLKESEEQLRSLADSIPNLAWWANGDGFITWYNRRWYEYSGTTPEQMEGWGWQSVHDPGELPKVLERWQGSIATGAPFEMTFPLRGADGVFRPFLTRVIPLKDAAGRVLQWFGTNTDISVLKQAEDQIKASLAEKEVMLREIHHRVKNNLQVISSLVGLQADGTEDETVRAVLRDVTFRVRSMALVHEKLYQTGDLARIDFAEYARSLLSYLWRAHGSAAAPIRLTFDLEPLSLPVDIAVPCGLILNELAGNALKHAFRGRNQGEVAVSLHRTPEGHSLLCLRDNGVGLPPQLDWRQAPSLGLRLVQMLAGQLNATVEVSGGEGTKFEITFVPPEVTPPGLPLNQGEEKSSPS
jgi:PAS domain S-box-containing protein